MTGGPHSVFRRFGDEGFKSFCFLGGREGGGGGGALVHRVLSPNPNPKP